ncbi:MAG: hypothetical protein KatS3mg101_0957 [Patescibacteria group bacterium]|nr:MAG: hypothetical protein KatS3mg101_0957 [Patescibacteria group bacterium]
MVNIGRWSIGLRWGLKIEDEKVSSQTSNELEKKIISAELALRLYFYVKRDIRKAMKAARLLYQALPNEENKEMLDSVSALYNLDIASEHIHKIC